MARKEVVVVRHGEHTEFLQLLGGWSPEFPDAGTYNRRTGKALAKQYNAQAIINYGDQNEEVIFDGEKPDVLVENHGSIFLFRPMTAAATEWIEANVQEDAQFMGTALAVEYRYAPQLAEGMQGDGLIVR